VGRQEANVTLSLLEAGFGPSSPSSGPDWLKLVGAILVALVLLLISGPFYCAPVPAPGRLLHDDPLANYATTWSHSDSTEGGLG